MDMLKIENLKKSFGDKDVLKGISLSVPEKSIFGFIGKNGAGKTTTMKTVLGLMNADEGEIYVNGEKVVYGQTSTNRYIGYLPDVPEYYSFMSPMEYLNFCGEITGLSKTERVKRSEELLELVGLKGEKHRIKGFSRGMKQRLGIAQALLNKPKLLICDEPTSALDPVGRKEILDILMAVKNETTVLFSTHILSDVERICTDIAFINNGEVAIQGKLSDIKSTYRTDEYIIETECEEALDKLTHAFPYLHKTGRTMLKFKENEHSIYEVMNYLTVNKIAVIKIERLEPTLESLFMEVVKK